MYLIVMEVKVTMSLFKKVTAILISAVMLTALSACGESTRWSARINNTELRAGIYIYFSMNAYGEAQGYLEEGQTDVLAINIEDKPAVQWIQDKATKSMQEYTAIEEKFDELGLTLSEEELKYAESTYEYMKAMYSQYGMDYEKQFVDVGISRQTVIDIDTNAIKREAIFNYYYDEGGAEEVSKDVITQYMKDNYAYVNYIAMPLKDGAGNLLKSDGKANIKKMAEDYITRAKKR